MPELGFTAAAREVTRPVEKPTEKQIEVADTAPLGPVDAYEAARAAYISRLDEQVRNKKITLQEEKYLIARWENGGLDAVGIEHDVKKDTPGKDELRRTTQGLGQGLGMSGEQQPRRTTRGLGMTDRADMVSQQRAVTERLKDMSQSLKPGGLER